MIYFTADNHFYHKNIIKYCNRPFQSVEEMNHSMIQSWNNMITNNDIVYILGDLSLGNLDSQKRITQQLNGQKILILGNHDCEDSYKNSDFIEVIDYKEVCHNNRRFVLFHYPLMSWHKSNKGSIMIHGHCHGNNVIHPNSILNKNIIDVGVDCNHYMPFSINDILQRIKK